MQRVIGWYQPTIKPTAKDRKSLKAIKLLRMIKDERLEEFNRGLLYILYTSYLYKLNDLKSSNNKIALLKKDSNDFPLFLRTAIVQLKQRRAKDEN